MGDKEPDKMVQGMGTGASLHGSTLGAATRRCLGFPSTVMLTRHGFPQKKYHSTKTPRCHHPQGLHPTSGCSPPHLWVLPTQHPTAKPSPAAPGIDTFLFRLELIKATAPILILRWELKSCNALKM